MAMEPTMADQKLDGRLDATLKMLSSGPRGKSTLGSTKSLPSFHLLTEDYTDPEPGPGTYELPSSLGKSLGYPSPPEYSLTSRHDKAWNKAIITKSHSVGKGKDSPGFIYSLPEEFGAHPRKSNWEKWERQLGKPATKPQGPGKWYNVRKDLSVASEVKGYQGLSRRFWKPGHTINVGPGQYEHKSCIDSGYKAKSFGASFRAYDHVWYRDCERANLGRCSPGPGPYRQDFGKDAQQVPMGLDMKLRPVKLSDTPQTMGPGYYKVNDYKRFVEKNVVSHEKTPNSCSFGKPRRKRSRFDWKKLRPCGESPNFFCGL